jgi:hypothetical protein
MGRTPEAGRDRDRTPDASDEASPPFPDLLRACSSSAVHLEMRDAYTPDDPLFLAWLAGNRDEFATHETRPWLDLMREVTGRHVRVRRARIVSEPVTECIRFEYDTTASNIGAGEDVRWLPRHLAAGLLLPALDFWVFDGRRARFNLFSGTGEFLDTRMCDDPVIVRQCADAFEAVWDRAIPHADDEPR